MKQTQSIPILPHTLEEYEIQPELFLDDLNKVNPQGPDDTIGLRGIYGKELWKIALRPSWHSPENVRERRLSGTSAVIVAGTWAYTHDDLITKNFQEAVKRVSNYGDQEYVAVVQGKLMISEEFNDPGEIVIGNAHVIAYIKRATGEVKGPR